MSKNAVRPMRGPSAASRCERRGSLTSPRAMLRRLRHSLLVLVAAGCASGGPSDGTERGRSSDVARDLSGSAPLVGAWQLVETAVRTSGGVWDLRPAPQGGLFVFSARHYSYFYIRGAAARPRFADANRPTEAERAATFDTFIAGAGTYTFDGRLALLKADFRKNPNEMTGEVWPWQADFRGDTLRFVYENPPFLPGRNWRLTLIRVE